MKIEKANKILLHKFKECLDEINYHLMLTILLGESNYFTNPVPDYFMVKKELKKIDTDMQGILAFLLLGDPVKREIVEKFISQDVINHLYDLEVLNFDDNHYWLNNYLLTSYSNCYFLVSNVYYYPTCQNNDQKPYIGVDTYWLTRAIINMVHGDVLDLCTGSGIQAIISAKTADRVIAVDIDTKSKDVAIFNTYINNVENKVDVRCGDLYNVIDKEERFDFILSNPPFIPIPKDIDFPIAGNGGEDGKDIIKNILNGYTLYLKPNGRALMIGQAIGNESKVFLDDTLDSMLPDMSYVVIYSDKTIINQQANGFAELARKINGNNSIHANQWMDIYNNIGADYFYNFTIIVTNNKRPNRKMYLNDRWNKTDIPNIDISSVTKLSETYTIKISNNNSLAADDELTEFIRRMDGVTSVQEIIAHMPFKFKIKYGKEGELTLLLK